MGTKEALLQGPRTQIQQIMQKGQHIQQKCIKKTNIQHNNQPLGTQHTDSTNIFQTFTTKTHHNKNPSQQPTSLLFDFPSTKTHHNNQHLSFFQQSLKKKKKSLPRIAAVVLVMGVGASGGSTLARVSADVWD